MPRHRPPSPRPKSTAWPLWYVIDRAQCGKWPVEFPSCVRRVFSLTVMLVAPGRPQGAQHLETAPSRAHRARPLRRCQGSPPAPSAGCTGPSRWASGASLSPRCCTRRPTCTLDVIANALIVICSAPCMTVATNGRALGDRTNHVFMVLEQCDGYATLAPVHNIGAIASRERLGLFSHVPATLSRISSSSAWISK